MSCEVLIFFYLIDFFFSLPFLHVALLECVFSSLSLECVFSWLPPRKDNTYFLTTTIIAVVYEVRILAIEDEGSKSPSLERMGEEEKTRKKESSRQKIKTSHDKFVSLTHFWRVNQR